MYNKDQQVNIKELHELFLKFKNKIRRENKEFFSELERLRQYSKGRVISYGYPDDVTVSGVLSSFLKIMNYTSLHDSDFQRNLEQLKSEVDELDRRLKEISTCDLVYLSGQIDSILDRTDNESEHADSSIAIAKINDCLDRHLFPEDFKKELDKLLPEKV